MVVVRESKDFSLHFSQIAKQYRYLRATDVEPIIYIMQRLNSRLNLPHIDAADIGCGDGRYSLLLSKYLDGKLQLRCVDNNEHMLETLASYLNTNGVRKFQSVKADAESLPFGDNSLDCVVTFNAVHHFKLGDFWSRVPGFSETGGYFSFIPEHQVRTAGISGAGISLSSIRKRLVFITWMR